MTNYDELKELLDQEPTESLVKNDEIIQTILSEILDETATIQDKILEKLSKKYNINKTVLLKDLNNKIQSRKQESKLNKSKEGIEKETAEKLGKEITYFFDKLDLAERFIKIQPIYYDHAKNWWIWDHDNKCWVRCDEIEIMNNISKHSQANTINAKEKNEILEALKQVGRLNAPENLKPTWIQFRNKIIDINNNEEYEASPKYFTVNPIPWAISEEELTPTMDRYFKEWVGEENLKTLYQIIAYCLLPDYPLNRIFCLYGAGANGKSCFLRILNNFLGKHNLVSTELDLLSKSRFELSKLHKKLACIMGETNINKLDNTAVIKKITGNDLVGFEWKNASLLDDKCYAKILIATNALPITSDKTYGFYRRWLIIDFPNTFKENGEIKIPDEEYNNLTRKSITLLKELMSNKEFHNEGSVEDREKRYEEKSNPLNKFIKEKIVEGDCDDFISKSKFNSILESWLIDNRYRKYSYQEINKFMKENGFHSSKRYKKWYYGELEQSKQVHAWINIKWKKQ